MAGLLTAAEIAGMQATQATAWPDTGIVIRASGTVDGMGGYTNGTVAAGTIAGRLMPMGGYSSNETLGAAQPLSIGGYWWSCAYSADIDADDMLRVGNQLLRVVEVNLDVNWETAKRCKMSAYNQGVL